jgi:16S rRNA C1402 (ribose-2'-O) methylase RsmI
MTKIHEEYIRGAVSDVLRILEQRSEQKGEFSVFVSGWQSHLGDGGER